MSTESNVLVVVAHPDDEGLGAGGTITRLVDAGHSVSCCLISGEVKARSQRPHNSELNYNIKKAQKILGLKEVVIGDFPNIELNTVPHLKIVQFIESCITSLKINTIFTHHPSDLNNDHTVVSHSCLAASRLWQRRNDIPRLQDLYFMEIQSSTDWAFNGHSRVFEANSFVELSEGDLERKILAVEAYKNVMRQTPHPRSRENMIALARYRGSQAGFEYAEAFQRIFGGITALEI